ncbi:MAG: galactosyltransferase-related protein [Vicinamibacterales bacterium]
MRQFSVVIPWRNRPEIEQTLEANAHLFVRHSAEVVVVNCGGDAAALSTVLGNQRGVAIRPIGIPHDCFNRSLANNIGALYSEGAFVFFLDADVILKTDILEETRGMLEEQNCVVHVRKVYESNAPDNPKMAFVKELVHTREISCVDGRRAMVRSIVGGDGSRGGSGLMIASKAHLLRVGGFNSTLKGWGYEDSDLTIRLQFELGLDVRMIGEATHLTHGDDRRGVAGASRVKDYYDNEAACLERYSRGDHMGTYFDDEVAWQGKIQDLSPSGSPG